MTRARAYMSQKSFPWSFLQSMHIRFSDSEQWCSPAKPPRSQNYVKPHDARTRVHVGKVARAADRNLAAVEADLAFGSAPALPDAVAAPAMRFAGELLGIVAQHLLDSSNSGRQTKALE